MVTTCATTHSMHSMRIALRALLRQQELALVMVTMFYVLNLDAVCAVGPGVSTSSMRR